MPIAGDPGMNAAESHLRFIEAGRIRTSSGGLDGALLISPRNATLGKLDGVLVDPSLRRVRYYVVESPGPGHAHHLVPLMPARLDAGRRVLEVDLESQDIDQLDDVEPADLTRFSDDDLITALFHSQTQ
jgi:hypothetical protein